MAESYNAGIVTAYGAAVRGGYTGTYDEFCNMMANSANNAAEADAAADRAEAVLESIPSDYSTLSNDVSDLKAELSEYEGIFTADVDESVQNWLNVHPEATTTVEDGSLTLSKFADSLKKQIVVFFDTATEMIESTSLISGMTAVTHGYSTINDGKGSIYRISSTKPLTVSITLNSGLYAEEISQPLDGEMVMNDDSSKQWLADCALNWINHAGEIHYEGDKNLFFDDTEKIDGYWSMTCSIFAMAMVFGIDFDHSKYNGLTANEPNPNAYKDDVLLNYLRNPEGFYSDDILPYLMTRGFVFKPTSNLSNVQTGDILFYAFSNGYDETNFMGINHTAIFAYHNNDKVHTVWEVTNDVGPKEQTYQNSYADESCLFVARLPFKQHNDAPFENLLSATTSSTTQVQQIQCALNGTVETNKWYTFVCKVSNIAWSAAYPSLYAGGFSRKLVSYNSGYVARPYNDIYIMPFHVSTAESGYLYPSLVARSDGTTGNPYGDFEWVCLVEGFYTDLCDFVPYFVNFQQQISNIGTILLGIENFTNKVTTTHTKGGAYNAIKNNKVCNIVFDVTLTSNVNAWSTIATIADGYRPIVQQLIGDIYITATGNIATKTALTSGDVVQFSIAYITN